MANLPSPFPAARLALLLGAAVVATGSGCGRMVLGLLPADKPDGGDVPGATPDAGTPDGGDAPGATPDAPPVCTADGWCWTHPLPTSDRLVNAFAVGPDDLWFISASGTIVRFAGGVWSAIPSPTNALSTIWASASNDVWVGGAAGPFHWDGQSWMLVPPPTSPGARQVDAVWGCRPDDVWAMGVVATRWDGHELSFINMPATANGFRTLWGSACDDIWGGYLDAALGVGRIAHWNGSTWTNTEDRPAEQITGTGSDDVWSLAQGQLYHWSGLAPGTLQDSHTLNLFPLGGAAVGTMSDSRTVTVHARGGAATSLPAPAPDGVSALWGRSASDLWGFGARGAASHWNGTSWTNHLPTWALGAGDAVRVTGSGPGDLWAIVGNTLLHGDGVTWSTALTAQQVGDRIYDVWARAPDDVWVLGGDKLIHHWDHTSWTTMNPPLQDSTTGELHAISGSGPNDVWILRGHNSVLHWDGSNWINRQTQVDNLIDIWAPGPNEVWVVGDGVEHWSGSGWSVPRIPFAISNAPFTAVGGSGPNDVWILAGGYALKVSDNYGDLNVAMSSSWHAASLAPASGGGVWVVFQNGAIDSRIFHLTSIDPNTRGPTQVAPAGLNDVWAAPDGTLWAAGSGGALIRKRPTAP